MSREAVLNQIVIISLLLLSTQAAKSQASNGSGSPQAPSGVVGAVFNYLSMAGMATAADFQPLSQSERNSRYLKSLINPVLYFKASLSAAIDQANDKPHEWEQGGTGYGSALRT